MTDNKYFSLKKLIISFVVVVSISLIFLGVSFHLTMIEKKMYGLDFCLQSECIKYMASQMEGTISLAQGLGWLITLLTGIGGAYLALKTYISGVNNSNITNHISHINMFRDFVNLEVTKRKRISPSSVDIYTWYSLIFPNSKGGDLAFCYSYIEIVNKVKAIIDEANVNISTASGDYVYKLHQQRMIESLKILGVVVSRGPKNSYIEIEGEVLEVIDSVNSTFISGHCLLSEIHRKYT